MPRSTYKHTLLFVISTKHDTSWVFVFLSARVNSSELVEGYVGSLGEDKPSRVKTSRFGD